VRIAVVIPALDEAREIADAIESASVPAAEIVVVDGGSGDGTAVRAREAGARVLASERGRARQLQAGVDGTVAETLLFLHADTRLPPGWNVEVQRALEDPGVCGGAFRLRFDDRRLGLRVIEWWVRLRVAVFGLPFGDQAIFVRRDVLIEIGGVPQAPVMEDVDLVTAMKTRGRLVALRAPVTTSARRYLRGGVLRTALRHSLALGARLVGFDRVRIQQWLGR
jgi:rSAM/selenodomain-associated transferase 2